MKGTILVVDDEKNVLEALVRTLNNEEYVIIAAASAAEAFDILKTQEVHIVMADQKMPNITGNELLKQVKEMYPDIITMMISGYADFEAIQEAINEGHVYKFVNKPWDNDKLRRCIDEAMMYAMGRKFLKRARENYFTRDRLTELFNRDTFINILNKLNERDISSKKTVVVMVIDIDRFRYINNQFGQHIGNQILRAMAERLRTWRQNEEKIARIGDDEFGIIIDNVVDLVEIEATVRELNEVLSAPYMILEREVYITCSTGVAMFPRDTTRLDRLIEKAHLAVGLSKQLGGSLCQFYEPSMEREENMNLLLEAEIRKGIEAREFVNFYQPIVNFCTGEIVGAEALVRWQHPQKGLLGPMGFIPICELSGLIMPIDRLVFKTALEHLQFFMSHDVQEIYISSNFSTRHFMLMELYDLMSCLIENTKIDPKKITIEVTERLLLQQSDVVLNNIEALSRLGVRLAIDDFGTGYASLSYLKKYPFNVIKIDRSYTREIGRKKNDEMLIVAMINMVKSLGKQVIAEGVETQEQINFLRAHGCDYGQGFIFSQPLSFDTFFEKLKTKEFTESIRQRIGRDR